MSKGKGRGEEARLGWNVFEISKAVNQFDGQEAWQEEEEDQATLAASTYEFITLSGITSTLSWHRLAHAPLRSSSSVSPPLPPWAGQTPVLCFAAFKNNFNGKFIDQASNKHGRGGM